MNLVSTLAPVIARKLSIPFHKRSKWDLTRLTCVGPIKSLQGVVKRVVRLTKHEENTRWGLKLLIPLSKEVTNGKLT